MRGGFQPKEKRQISLDRRAGGGRSHLAGAVSFGARKGGTPMPNTYLTPEDEQNYGRDLIDFAQRAAAEVVGPHLQNLKQQNTHLQQQLAREQRHRLDQQVAAAIPNYMEIDRDPAWHRWLMGVDSLNGCSRQQLMSAAIGRSDPVSVIALFRAYIREQGGGGRRFRAQPLQISTRRQASIYPTADQADL
jgi:hypothetical protein